MKVKDIARTANVAWSPAQQYPIYMAAGTAAQQLDATFSTSAALEIYGLNLADQSMDMEKTASINVEHRFHNVVWGKHGMSNSSLPSGMIAGGTDNGGVYMYNAAKLLEGSDAFIGQLEKHTGTVKALDFNPFQSNLLATGAGDSEIYIWDLNNPTTPMTPGAKSQPPDEISCLAWNRQVQHILASTCPGGRCVVWDLKKNEPIIKVTDHSSRMRCKAVAWHPEVATQMVLASEDDYSPVIQMWDLRFATSPLKVLQKHERGVLSIAWCQQDPDLLLSCAKDNRILVWNPNSNVPGGEVVFELPTSSQWSFDVQFCPRNPAVISSSSFDGHVSIYSLMGGGYQDAASTQSDKIASSFGADGFGQEAPAEQPRQVKKEPMLLKKPPKWLRRPVGATFGFGGKLISYTATAKQQVNISQVVTETELVNRSNALEEALAKGSFVDFCNQKIGKAKDDTEKEIWKFLKVNFEKEPRSHFIGLLGHDPHELSRKVALATGAPLGLTNGMPGAVDAEELAERMEHLSTGSRGSEAKLGSSSGSPSTAKTPNNSVGDSDAGAAVFDAISAGGLVEVENQEEQESRAASPFTISKEEDTDGLVSQAILTGNFEAAVEMCLHDDRMADAILLAIAGGPELLASTQRKYFKKSKSHISRLISSIVTKDLKDIVQCCELENWKESLTALLTYATAKEFSSVCDTLGERLEAEDDGKYSTQAFLCYICAGNVDKLVSCWAKITQNASAPLNLQDLVEKVMILRKAVELKSGSSNAVSSSILADKLSEYSHLLAAQGKLGTANTYLGDSTQPKIVSLKERLHRAQGGGATSSYAKAHQSNNQYQKTNAAQQQQGYTQQNAFNTTTVSSSQYYNSQVSATAQPSQYTSYTYSNQSPATSTQQSPGYGTDSKAASTAATAAPTSGGDMHARLSGPRKYPSAGYQQSGMQQYYAPSQTSTTAAAPSQPGYVQPTTGMYNPTSYAPTSQPQPVDPYQQQTQQPVQPVSAYQPSTPPPINTSTSTPQKPRVEGAWNDPPIVKPKKTQASYVPPQPITAPIIGAPVEQTPPSNPGMQSNMGGGQVYNPYMQQQVAQSQQDTNQAYSAAPGASSQSGGAPPQAQGDASSQQASTVSAPAPKQEIAKAPVPAEHQILCDTYDALLKRCSEKAANSAQTKRKLEDVNRKLNILYDKLREGMVSAMILQGLHEIAQFIEQFDYQQGLMVHTRLVSSGNFSEISAFMPGLKVLMQVGLQLRV